MAQLEKELERQIREVDIEQKRLPGGSAVD
jgi:hypothetical protein